MISAFKRKIEESLKNLKSDRSCNIFIGGDNGYGIDLEKCIMTINGKDVILDEFIKGDCEDLESILKNIEGTFKANQSHKLHGIRDTEITRKLAQKKAEKPKPLQAGQSVGSSSLEEMSYKELQKLAKKHGIRANMARKDMIKELRKVI